ncbi:AfsR/SARP family transcriptional regulator [Calidithermus chliarophilus]|uniref:AfsR/SARP family transcriptional regulator n=1 Tax=Calidithermus chliarophilus TaxID=52023 RepID=UPI00041857DB|nr:BTAD domain-containing putative transcriptional regulator [Calidithermus chliarophilus]
MTVSAARLQVRTLGEAEVWLEGRPVQWRADSARLLFFYLLAHPEGRSREQILEALWDAAPDAGANNRFRVTVHRIRVALGWPGAVLEEHGRYRLAPEVLRASDVGAFYQALERAGRAEAPQARLRGYQRALELYRGEFLPQEGAEWAGETREQVRAAYVQAELALSRLFCGLHQCPASVAALARALHADPYLGEDQHQRLMGCLNAVEGKYAAIEHYRRFLHFLREELGDSPMPETLELAEHLKRDEAVYWPGPEPGTRVGTDFDCPRLGNSLVKTR